ncbi:MAG: hypothetical protein ACKUBY_05375 [Candidatus Moraniibacteriota bacterium]
MNISNIFVAKNAKKRAFVEQFEHKSVNFTQKNLGTIFGFFIVRDSSPTSENIVNFLSSEVKKKYFSPVTKDADEKFEITLHHINRILEEIANIGNIDWIGTIDSAICVINNTSITFSVTGNAHILLLRDNALMDISEGLASKEASEYPLKTFIDISSGELCPDDKLIITSPELLDYVSFAELQKNAIHFGHDNFIQFIQTVLTNECSMATATVIEINQKEQSLTNIQVTKQLPSNEPVNAFGATAFEKNDTNLKNADIDTDELLKDTEREIEDEWTDEKGHIHIQGTDEEIPEQTILETTQEKINDLSEQLQEFSSKKFKKISKSIAALRAKQTNESLQTDQPEDYENTSIDYIEDDFDDEVIGTDINESKTTGYIEEDSINNEPKKTKQLVYTVCTVTKNATKNTTVKCVRLITNLRNKLTKNSVDASTQEISKYTEIEKKSILPSFHHITNLWHTMSTQTKLISIGILLFIILAPIFFMMISSKSGEKVIEEPQKDTSTQEQLPEEKPIEPISSNTIEDATILLEDSNIVSTLFMKDSQLGISKQAITLLNGTKKDTFKIPSDAGEIKLATNMDDLDLIFFLTTSDKVYSFSPIVKKFTQQKNIPSIKASDVDTLNSFMTYIYTTDDKQIKRYTRQENGFVEGENWLTADVNLSKTTTLAIDDDIYTARDGKISKFSSHKKAPFSQDPTIQNAFLIYTTPDTSNMWILDKEQKTVFKTKKESGKKLDEFVHDDFANATSLTIDEKNNKIVISTPDKILSFKI